MKKVIAGLSVLGVVAGFSVFADGYVPMGDLHSKISVRTNNNANINTFVANFSNTGLNSADADSYTGGKRSKGGGSSAAMGGVNVTGKAWASTGILLDVNPTTVDVDQSTCGCVRDGDTWLKTKVSTDNTANINTFVLNAANTGGNSADASSSSHGKGSSRAYAGANSTGDAEATTVIGIAANSTSVSIQH